MVKIYYDEDADLSFLKDKKIAVIGYGSQGEPQALNMRDSGLDVIVGVRQGPSWETARKAGFEVYPIKKAAKLGDVLLLLLPDEAQPAAYETMIKDQLKEGKVLDFASGFNIHYGFIKPPGFVDVVLVAPEGSGYVVRSCYLNGSGVPVLIGVQQDYSGKARDISLALAKAIGGTRVGAIESSFKEEAEVDLFTEVAGLTVAISHLMNIWQVMVKEGGFSPEAAYTHTFYNLAYLSEQIRRHSLRKMVPRWSNTAKYVANRFASNFFGEEYWKATMKNLQLVKNGDIAKDWTLEAMAGCPTLKCYMEQFCEHPIHEVSEFFAKIVEKQETHRK